MATGIEPLLGPALTKAAGTGAARAAGWGGQSLLKIHRRRKVRALLDAPASVVAALDEPEDVDKLLRYFESPEIAHFAASLTRAYVLERSGSSADELIDNVKNEFFYSLATQLGHEPQLQVARTLFEALNESVLLTATKIARSVELSPKLNAELIKTAASLSAASARNAELLSRLRDMSQIERFCSQYANQVKALDATMRLPHAGTTRQVPYDDLFVTPQLFPPPDHQEEDPKPVPVEQVLSHAVRVVLLGNPGGGKSTLSNKLTYDIARGGIPSLIGRVPFYVVLGDYAGAVRGPERKTLVDYISSLCRSPYNVEPPENVIEYLLLNDRALLILDGLDELLDTALRRDTVRAVEGFAHRYPNCPIVVTSRRVGYEEAPLDEDLFVRLELGDFNDENVGEYVRKWFALDESITEARQEKLAEAFISDSQFVSDIRVNPLLLSLMCGIYASENYIPRNRPDVYEKCAMLLFERWDKQRGINSPLPFDAHVQAAMRSLALHMFTEPSVEGGIPRQQLVEYMKKYLLKKRFEDEETAEDAANNFIDFCKGRAWVLSDIGAETYGFTHRTFLEYFAASQLVRLTHDAQELFEFLLPHLREENWEVVSQLALQILGRTVEDGADDFLRIVINEARKDDGFEYGLLAFAGRALQFIVPRPAVIHELVSACVENLLAAPPNDCGREQVLLQILTSSVSDENRPRVGQALRERLRIALNEDNENSLALLIALRIPLFNPVPPRFRSSIYWQEWVLENEEFFAAEVLAQRAKVFWVGLISVERDDYTLANLLDDQGPIALYLYKFGGVIYDPPFAYRFLVSGGKDRQMYSSPTRRKKRYQSRNLSVQLLQKLPAQTLPWFTYDPDFDVVLSSIEAHLDSRKTRLAQPAAAVLLALPLIEMSLAISRSWIEHAEGLVQTLGASRDGRIPVEKALELLQPLMADHANAYTFTERWLRSEFDLVDGLPVRAGADAIAQ